MSDSSVVSFVASQLSPAEVQGKNVLEIGSMNINGGSREYVTSLRPAIYLGIDMRPGPGVDLVLEAKDAVGLFGRNTFDVVIATEILEHALRWREVMTAMKALCRVGGVMIVTVPRRGFRYHAHPFDHWRFEPSDLEHLYADCEFRELKRDEATPRTFMKAVKTDETAESTPHLHIFNIVFEDRMAEWEASESSRRYRLLGRVRAFKVFVQDIIGILGQLPSIFGRDPAAATERAVRKGAAK